MWSFHVCRSERCRTRAFGAFLVLPTMMTRCVKLTMVLHRRSRYTIGDRATPSVMALHCCILAQWLVATWRCSYTAALLETTMCDCLEFVPGKALLSCVAASLHRYITLSLSCIAVTWQCSFIVVLLRCQRCLLSQKIRIFRAVTQSQQSMKA